MGNPKTSEPWVQIPQDRQHEISAGQLQFMEVIVGATGSFDFTGYVGPAGQDYSIQLWISKDPGGTPQYWNDDQMFPLKKEKTGFSLLSINSVMNQSRTTTSPRLFILPPGIWYINVKNRENADLIWYFDQVI